MPTRPPTPMHLVARAVLAASVLVMSLVPATSGASGFPRLDFRIQYQVAALAGVRLPDAEHTLTAMQVNASLYGIGLAAELGYEGRAATVDQARYRGGYLSLAAQFRYLTLVNKQLFRYLDPHVHVGVLGGAGDRGGSLGRAAVFVGAGVDVAVPYRGQDDLHPVVTLQYRMYAAQTPDDLPRHLLVIGVGARFAQ